MSAEAPPPRNWWRDHSDDLTAIAAHQAAVHSLRQESDVTSAHTRDALRAGAVRCSGFPAEVTLR